LILNAASVELWFIASSKVTVIIVSMGISILPSKAGTYSSSDHATIAFIA
jgi:hypothetical protein